MSERIIWDITEQLPPREVIGTKAYNLMLMKRAGFPVPGFFTLLGNRPAGKPLEKQVIEAASQLEGDLMLRSCHPMESGIHPFSGKFLSEWCSPEEERIQDVYADIISSASDKEVQDYLRQNNIANFDPNAMNVIFMRDFPHRFFGMYMTSSQANPSEMIVNYYDNTLRKGGWEIFDKATKTVKAGRVFDEQSNEAIIKFGEHGIRAEDLFREPVQIEAAINQGGELAAFQAKHIELTNPLSLAKPSEYKTMITGLQCQGYTHFKGPVLVLDEVSNSLPGSSSRDKSAINHYRAEIEDFMGKNPRYILVMKELAEFVSADPDSPEDWMRSREEQYAYLNRIVKNAAVQIRSKAQSVVRHESWDNIEKGGAIVFVDYDHIDFENRFNHKSRSPEHKQKLGEIAYGRESVYMRGRGLTPITISHRHDINTGDELEVLCNEEGVFIW